MHTQNTHNLLLTTQFGVIILLFIPTFSRCRNVPPTNRFEFYNILFYCNFLKQLKQHIVTTILFYTMI